MWNVSWNKAMMENRYGTTQKWNVTNSSILAQILQDANHLHTHCLFGKQQGKTTPSKGTILHGIKFRWKFSGVHHFWNVGIRWRGGRKREKKKKIMVSTRNQACILYKGLKDILELVLHLNTTKVLALHSKSTRLQRKYFGYPSVTATMCRTNYCKRNMHFLCTGIIWWQSVWKGFRITFTKPFHSKLLKA